MRRAGSHRRLGTPSAGAPIASVASAHRLVAYELPEDSRLFGGKGLYEAEIRFRLEDDVSDLDAAATAQRAAAVLETTNPTDWHSDGLRVMQAVTWTDRVGGRPGVVVRLDVERH